MCHTTNAHAAQRPRYPQHPIPSLDRLRLLELHPFKQYAGSKARYETDSGTEELEVYTHHISDYIGSAENNGFELLGINEWFDTTPEKEIPRLISFVFKKKKQKKTT